MDELLAQIALQIALHRLSPAPDVLQGASYLANFQPFQEDSFSRVCFKVSKVGHLKKYTLLTPTTTFLKSNLVGKIGEVGVSRVYL